MIIEHGNTLISDEVLLSRFVCDLDSCKGACCVEGDRGAPLDPEDIEAIQKNIEQIKPFMSRKGLELLKFEGFHEGMDEDDIATTCLPTGECVFAYRENGILGCAIEKAYKAGKIDYYKPISCHLYPIRLGRIGDKESINYHQWSICKAACALGNKLNVPVFQFLKEPLIRKYGQEWFDELELIYEEYLNQLKD
ncbi:MAG: DUF3109 family protein [Bacteroidetes bacterium]|nr:DUF3109 family protein [Bacteroidota bacterium]